MDKTIYFQDNFFSSGLTDIHNKDYIKVGLLDLKTAFSRKVSVLDLESKETMKGMFLHFLSRKWRVVDPHGTEQGLVQQKLFTFSKAFDYHKANGQHYRIESPIFSREYTIYDDTDQIIARFYRVSSFLSVPAFKLENHSNSLNTAELIIVIMGVNAIQKNNNNGAASST
ncbi:hypothetical protein [Cytobacillus purgationiresistens]|uniref:Uncharacterized protein n=1 Tax=Cytobacillus purgationiresistens TaxID=863449 RepID=A0ABU0AFF8_9BACI|nr:hypothetical protein [Cytobacillus purgationiresistens]MDQ0269451.1 hypothetical protein [Cytobacillus purgationiresistens]